MSTIAKLLARLELDTTGFKKGLGTIPGMLNNVGGGMSSVGSSITRNVTLPLLAAGAGAIYLGGQALQVGANFEKGMSGVSAILEATSEETKLLDDLAMNLGLSPELIISASGASAAMEELGKNGITVQQILDGAAEGTIALSNATGSDLTVAAEIASGALQVFNVDASDMEKVVNQVTGVLNQSKLSAVDYADALGMGGAAAASNGVSLEDFNATIAASAVYMTGGSDAGTSFKTFLTRLTPVTDKATDLMRELGLVTEDGSNAFYDANGNMKDMAEIAGIMESTFAGMTEMERANNLEILFGADASRMAIALMETGQEKFESLSDSINKTDAAENAATRMDNLAGSTEILGGIVEAFQIKFTKAIGPGARTMVETFSQFLADNSSSIEGMFLTLSTVFDNFGTNFGPWLAENGPKFIAFIDKMILALPGFIEKMSEIGTAVAPQIEKLFTAFMNADPNSIVKIMEAVAGLAVLGPILTVLGGAITTISGVMSIIGTIGGVITGAVVGPLLLIIATLGLVVYAFATDFGGIATAAEQLLWLIGYYVVTSFEKVKTFFTDLGTTIKTKIDGIKTTVDQLKFIFEYVSKGVTNAIGKMITKIGEFASKLLTIKLPAWLMPGSPTPFEIGLLGIVSAMDKVNKTGLPGLNPNQSGLSMPQYASGNQASSSNGNTSSKTTQINIYNPKKETSEESVQKTLNRLSYLRVIE